MSEKIFEQVKNIIASQFDKKPEDINLETRFYNDLAADSLDLFQMITDLEDKFGLEFNNESAEKIKTVGDVVEYIKNCKQK